MPSHLSRPVVISPLHVDSFRLIHLRVQAQPILRHTSCPGLCRLTMRCSVFHRSLPLSGIPLLTLHRSWKGKTHFRLSPLLVNSILFSHKGSPNLHDFTMGMQLIGSCRRSFYTRILRTCFRDPSIRPIPRGPAPTIHYRYIASKGEPREQCLLEKDIALN